MDSRAFDFSSGRDAAPAAAASLQSRYVLVPFLHLCNHRQPHDATAFYAGSAVPAGPGSANNDIVVRTKRTVEPGTEITLCYYEMTDAESLSSYGFVGAPMRCGPILGTRVDALAGGGTSTPDPSTGTRSGYSHKVRLRSPMVEPAFYAFCHRHSKGHVGASGLPIGDEPAAATEGGATDEAVDVGTGSGRSDPVPAAPMASVAPGSSTEGADPVILRLNRFVNGDDDSDPPIAPGKRYLTPFTFEPDSDVVGSSGSGGAGGGGIAAGDAAAVGAGEEVEDHGPAGGLVTPSAMGLGAVPEYCVELGLVPRDFEESCRDPSGASFLARLLTQVEMLTDEIVSPSNGGTSISDDIATIQQLHEKQQQGKSSEVTAADKRLLAATTFRYREKIVLEWVREWCMTQMAELGLPLPTSC